MEGLDPAVEDLLLAGELGDVGDFESGFTQGRRGAAGREDLDAVPGEALGEVDHSGLVGDRDQRTLYLDRPVGRVNVVHLHLCQSVASVGPSMITRRGLSAAILTRPRAIMPIASG